jgi:YidC/Oxa1 family membrane protein insertase
MKFPGFGIEWKELRKFEKVELEDKTIVFYAENSASYNHFRLLIEKLTDEMGIAICYVTSIKDDKIFQKENQNVKSFYIGNGSSRTKFFLTLKTRVLVMDMPDLEKYHIKRSKVFPVHYVYLFHSMFSIHSYLRKGALDNFDAIFCVGKHHVDEIRETEKTYNLKEKILINYGFGRLDFLLKEAEQYKDQKRDDKLIIIAPSYGENNLLQECGIELIDILLKSKFKVILRPHYRIIRDSKELIKSIEDRFNDNTRFLLEKGVIQSDDFHSSKCMITDWSGIGMEYAFIKKNKVIFIDVPKKEMNDESGKIDLEPIEISIRNKIGHVVSPKELDLIPELINNNEIRIEGIEDIQANTVFNVGRSASVGAEYIKKINVDNLSD